MQRTCGKCGHVHPNATGHQAEECPRCGAIYSKVAAMAQAGQAVRRVEPVTPEQRAAAAQARIAAERAAQADYAERLRDARHTGNWSGLPTTEVIAAINAVVLTTTPFVPGRDVAAVRDVISSEFAHAFGAVAEWIGGLARNIAGSGRSSATADLLQTARAQIMARLRAQAVDIGADAVIGLTFDYEEFSGANSHGVLVVVGTGTAVKLVDPVSR